MRMTNDPYCCFCYLHGFFFSFSIILTQNFVPYFSSNLCLCLFLYNYACLSSPCLSPSLSPPISLFLPSLSMCVCVSLSPSLSLYFFLYLSIPLSLSVSVSFSFFLSVSFSVILCFPLYLFLHLSASPSLHLFLCLSVFLSISLSLPFPLDSPCLSQSVSFLASIVVVLRFYLTFSKKFQI